MSARWRAAPAFRSFSPNARLQCPHRADRSRCRNRAGRCARRQVWSCRCRKGIENDVIALRRIQNGVGNQCNRLNRGMEIKSASLTFTRKAVGAGVIPDVGAIASEAAELNVVAMLLLAVAEHEDEFMP